MLEFTSRREMRGQSFSPLQSSSAAVTGQRLHPSMVQDCHGMNSNYLATQIVTLESPGGNRVHNSSPTPSIFLCAWEAF